LAVLDKVIDLSPEKMLAAAKQTLVQENQTIELCRALLDNRSWLEVSKIVAGMRNLEPESVRMAVLGYSTNVMLSGGPKANRCYVIMAAFSENFFYTKFAGLVAACFEASQKDNK
jgi:hypothetical protein